jgi:hypothetical protein
VNIGSGFNEPNMNTNYYYFAAKQSLREQRREVLSALILSWLD